LTIDRLVHKHLKLFEKEALTVKTTLLKYYWVSRGRDRGGFGLASHETLLKAWSEPWGASPLFLEVTRMATTKDRWRENRELRIFHGVTLAQIETATGICKARLSRLERGLLAGALRGAEQAEAVRQAILKLATGQGEPG
jgi:hypothetical protein